MIKNLMGGLAAALAVLVPLTAAPAQAAESKTFKAENAPTQHEWTVDGLNVDTLYFGMKNLQGEVTMHTKRLRFSTESNRVLVRSRQNQTFEVPAEVSTDNGRSWKKSSNTGLDCTLKTLASYQVVECDNDNTTRWEKNSILRWALPVMLHTTKTGTDIRIGEMRMAFQATAGWGTRKQEYETPVMTAAATID